MEQRNDTHQQASESQNEMQNQMHKDTASFLSPLTSNNILSAEPIHAQQNFLLNSETQEGFSFNHGDPENLASQTNDGSNSTEHENRAKIIGITMTWTEIVDEAYANVTYVPSSIGAGDGLEDLLHHTHYERSSHSPETVDNSSDLTNIAFIHPSLETSSQGYDSTAYGNHGQGCQRFGDTSTQDSWSAEGHDTLECSAHEVFGPGATIAGNLERNLWEPQVHKTQGLIIGSMRDFLNTESYSTQLESWVYETTDTNITLHERLEKDRWIDWK